MILTTPTSQPLEFTQGDTNIVLTFLCTDDLGNPQTLTSATIEVLINGPNGSGVVTFPNSQVTILNQSTNQGQFTLELENSGADTNSCGEGSHKEIFAVVTLSGVVQTYRGVNLLTVYGPSPFP